MKCYNKFLGIPKLVKRSRKILIFMDTILRYSDPSRSNVMTKWNIGSSVHKYWLALQHEVTFLFTNFHYYVAWGAVSDDTLNVLFTAVKCQYERKYFASGNKNIVQKNKLLQTLEMFRYSKIFFFRWFHDMLRSFGKTNIHQDQLLSYDVSAVKYNNSRWTRRPRSHFMKLPHYLRTPKRMWINRANTRD